MNIFMSDWNDPRDSLRLGFKDLDDTSRAGTLVRDFFEARGHHVRVTDKPPKCETFGNPDFFVGIGWGDPFGVGNKEEIDGRDLGPQTDYPLAWLGGANLTSHPFSVVYRSYVRPAKGEHAMRLEADFANPVPSENEPERTRRIQQQAQMILDWALIQSEAKQRRYDVALSFAGEDRETVESVAKALKYRGVRVFYDRDEQAELWGENLLTHLTEIYRTQARFTVIFISEHYINKPWTRIEREAAQARAFEQNAAYVLPVRLDDAELPGLLPTVSYLDLRQTSVIDLVDLIMKKLGRMRRI
ncbi:MAG: TIR domain-containing protein [Pseudomonadota bacterium]